MPGNDLIKPEIRREADGRLSFVRRAPIGYPTQVPKDLLRNPPKWAKSLVDRGTTFVELVETAGEVARGTESRAQRRSVLRVVEQLALTDEGRQTIDRVLTPGFIRWLAAVTPIPAFVFFPEIIVYQNANAPGREAWMSPWEDEDVWPEATLQRLQLDQAISAVWEDNVPPFVELFLFDGADLQGRFIRFARVHTNVRQLEVVLDASSLKDQSRSLLGSVRRIPGRRFSAEQELGGAVTQVFSEWSQRSDVKQFGTASLAEPPHFSWDGYDDWLKSSSRYPPLPKTAALRIHLVIRIDDVLYGTTTASTVIDTILQRTGGTTPIQWVEDLGTINVPAPWCGGIDPGTIRWCILIEDALIRPLSTVVAQQIGLLAGASPGSVRMLPGRSARVPNPPSTHWGLIEIGRTDDDATIVLSP
jgi:hypothetical protein